MGGRGWELAAEWLGPCAALWLLLELVFWYVVRFVWSATLDRLSPPEAPVESPEAHVERILGTLDRIPGYGIRAFLQGWFLGAELEDIRHGAVAPPPPSR